MQPRLIPHVIRISRKRHSPEHKVKFLFYQYLKRVRLENLKRHKKIT